MLRSSTDYSTPEFQLLADLLARIASELSPDEISSFLMESQNESDCCGVRSVLDR